MCERFWTLRYPRFYYRADKNFVDEENWKCFVNSVFCG
jgi:adenylylsulfate reductase, subunit A